jgi:hypothetical protein
MPLRKFEPRKWNAIWTTVADLRHGTATLHDKFWITDEPWVEPELVNLWNEAMNEMLEFHGRSKSGLPCSVPLESEIKNGFLVETRSLPESTSLE